MKTKINLKKITIASAVLLGVASLVFWTTRVSASAHLAGGDFMQAFNNTTQEGTWRDPITATSGQIVEYRVIVRNDGDQPAEDVQVWGSVAGQVPQDPSSQLVITSRIKTASFGGNEQTDTATVNVTGTPEGMRYVPGHARLNGVTSRFNCPNTCDISDEVLSGINIGTVAPGDFVEVAFKAGLTNTPATTPTPTPTTPVTPTPTVTTTPTPTPTGTITPSPTPTQVPTNITNNITNSNSQSQSQTQNNNQTVNVTQAAPAPVVVTQPVSEVKGTTTVTQLPKTGLPLAAWALSGLLPIGAGLKKFGGKNQTNQDSAHYLWQRREFDKDA